jgi:antagonist of KipI
MSIEILKPGLLSTLVGSERIGFRNVGVGSGGAMDTFAMKVANYLVGNAEQESVLEMYFPSCEILVRNTELISVTGKGFDVSVNDTPISSWKPIVVSKNSILKLNVRRNGGRAYVSVNGGWKSASWLGSFSTHLGVQAGGHFGQVIKKGAVIETSRLSNAKDSNAFNWGIASSELEKVYTPANEIRCIESIESNLLSQPSRTAFASTEFTISNTSNRMGFRLSGRPMKLDKPINLVSSAVDVGTIQLLPEGNLIILMADHQTTGGYPRIASVVKADLPKLAQLNPTEQLIFKFITLHEAEKLLVERQTQLEEIRKSCLLRMRN